MRACALCVCEFGRLVYEPHKECTVHAQVLFFRIIEQWSTIGMPNFVLLQPLWSLYFTSFYTQAYSFHFISISMHCKNTFGIKFSFTYHIDCVVTLHRYFELPRLRNVKTIACLTGLMVFTVFSDNDFKLVNSDRKVRFFIRSVWCLKKRVRIASRRNK